ncbi:MULTISPECIES: plasmid mobilization relaxosome protein MobC [Ralstonia]|uniref:plasmid mobilization protein n=1 Tax=Ralstonia TaxID=48736 RepID=UPI0026383366|nr:MULTISPECIES: plasmid mobilization relaxosome protein MobC [Ralstonia]
MKDRLEKEIHVRLSMEDFNLVHSKAVSLGFPKQSDYLRAMLKHEDKYVNLYRSLIYELKKQGVNLNQIAHKANTNPFSINTELISSLIEIERTYKLILEEIRRLK